tara:strand:+ start:1250 stop:1459 length:210 start_codon:yes stop_codon:yes gene_type:complete
MANKQITLNQKEYNIARQTAFVNKIVEGEHGTCELDVVITQTGPHGGKVICNTCNKHVAFIPKAVIETV